MTWDRTKHYIVLYVVRGLGFIFWVIEDTIDIIKWLWKMDEK